MADTTATKKTTAKKAPGKKAPAKKTAAKRSAKKSVPAKQAPTKKTAAARAEPSRREPSRQSSSGAQMARAAQEVVLGMTGKVPEAVTALERSDEGWRIAVDVMELERIPSTTDVMATYEVSLDEQGELQGYRRVHRYLRGTPGDE
jgi:hypothetical protein